MITEYVDRTAVDLLVMGAYGHSQIRNLIIGSTTTAMVRGCKVPVLMIRSINPPQPHCRQSEIGFS